MNTEKHLAYVFELPQVTPTFINPLPANSQRLVDRYLEITEDLTGSSLFKESQRFTYNVSGGVETIQRAEFLNRELTSGVGVMFRHLYSTNDEPASFVKICNLLSRHIQQEPDEIRNQGQPVIAAWRDAHGKLHGHTLEQLVRKKLAAEGKAGPYLAYGHEMPPQDLIAMYLYGEYIHSDQRRREALESARADPVLEGEYRMHFMKAMLAFAHIYIGFAKLIRTMSGPAR